MRILLTGGAGFIGSAVSTALTAHGHEVRVLDSLRADVHRDETARAAARARPGLVVGDVRDRAAVDAALVGVDVVCHLAAKVGLGVDTEDLADYADTNVTGTAVVLAAAAAAGCTRLVVASSMVVYGEGLGHCATHGPVRPGPRCEAALRAGRFEPPCPHCGAPLAPALVDEDAPTDPRNAYAASKLAQEHLTASWARLTQGGAVALRYHNVYGPGLPRDTPYAGVAALLLSSLRAGRAPQVFEDGGQRRDFVHVRDVAAATVAAVERVRPGTGLTAFNVGSGTPRTVGQLAQALADAVGGPSPAVTGGYRLGDVRHVTADSSRARAQLGWLPRVDFASGVAELAAARA